MVTAELTAKSKHKISSGSFSPVWYVRTEKWKLVGWDTQGPVLVDITKDIGETTDLSQKYSELASKKAICRMVKKQKEPAVFPEEQFDMLRTIQ